MTLLEYLTALPADPTDPTSPLLIVGEGALTAAQRQEVTGAVYNRRPYAVVIGLPRGSPLRLHNGGTRLSGGLDVHLNHPSAQIGPGPDGLALAELQALITNAPDLVDSLTPDYKLAKSLSLVTEVDPRPESFDTFNGLTATTRFTYAIWR